MRGIPSYISGRLALLIAKVAKSCKAKVAKAPELKLFALRECRRGPWQLQAWRLGGLDVRGLGELKD